MESIKGLNIQSTFSERTLTSEQQAIVDLVNSLLASYSDDQDNQQAARRLAAYLLETGDVASQQKITVYSPRARAAALGYKSDRTIRHICAQVEQEGLEALLNRVTGRPAVTTRAEVIEATLEEILAAVIDERDLPEDDELARRINRRLAQTDYDGESVTARMVQTIRQRKNIRRVATKQAFSSDEQKTEESSDESFSLGNTRWGGAFILLAFLIREAWLESAKYVTIASDYAVTPEQLLLTAIFAPICGINRAFHLDDVRDVGFSLLIGRPRPLTHGTFQHLIHALSLRGVFRFYRSGSQQQVEQADEENLRVSMDGHTVARFTTSQGLYTVSSLIFQKGAWEAANASRRWTTLLLPLRLTCDRSLPCASAGEPSNCTVLFSQ